MSRILLVVMLALVASVFGGMPSTIASEVDTFTQTSHDHDPSELASSGSPSVDDDFGADHLIPHAESHDVAPPGPGNKVTARPAETIVQSLLAPPEPPPPRG